MLEESSGFIKIEITQEHINACEAVFSYKEELESKLKQPTEHKWLFGMLTRVSYPNIKSECPALFTWSYEGPILRVYTKRWFEVLWNAICHCHGEEIYLSLDNYNSLYTIMEWWRDYE